MASYLDSVPFSGIIRIRDLMFTIKDPFRLDQGDISFDAPDSVKHAMARAIAENRTHYVQTTGVPRLLELLADKLRRKNGIPATPDEVMVTTGGIHGVYIVCQALLEPGDEVIVPDPEWPPVAGNVLAAHGVPIPCALRESLGWRYDLDELASKVTPRTRAIYLNSPNNPTGGVLTRGDLETVAALAEKHDLWVLSDEAYEDVVFRGEHASIAALPGMYARTIPIYTFSKSYAMTGLRLGYVAIENARIRERAKKVLFYTASNISSIVQFGGIGALEGPQDSIAAFRTELKARRDLFYDGLRSLNEIFTGKPADGAFYAFVRINPEWPIPDGGGSGQTSLSWRMAEFLIKQARVGCVPGVDFGQQGEGCLRFCFARERKELQGALESIRSATGVLSSRA
jgi:aspartate aminotransferase